MSAFRFRCRVRVLGVVLLAVVAVAGSSATGARAATTVSGTISSNTTWTTAGSPYLLSGSVTVASGVTLTINSGVYVKGLSSASTLRAVGSLVVNGSSGSPVVFTSLKDDSDGVDSGSDGATTPNPGDWTGLAFAANSGATTSTLGFAQIRYGGGTGNSKANGTVSISNGAVTLQDSVVEKSSVSGIVISGGTSGTDASLVLTRTKISDNGRSAAGAVHGDGINATNAQITMTDSAIWRSAEAGLEFGFTSGYTAGASSVTGSSIWMNGLKDGTSSASGITMNTSGLAIGKAPDGSGNNIYDNGNFLPTENWNQISETHGIGSPFRSDADWTNNFWAAYEVVPCTHTDSNGNGLNHVSYGVLEASTGTPVYDRGPIGSDIDFSGGSCTHDNLNGDPPAQNQLDLYFDTPPPVHGGLPLASTFGCLECQLAKYILAHSGAPAPGTPGESAGPRSRYHVFDPVSPTSGGLTESFTDISLPGPGIPFELVRTYNSRDTTSGVMGPGWTNALVSSLSIDGSGNVTYRSGDGQQTVFTKNASNYIGRATDLVLKKPSNYTLTTTDQRVFTYDTSGKLLSVKPRFGPSTTFSYTGSQLTGVTDSAGRSITLSYTSGLLTSVTLPDTRHVDYSYTSGKLTGITDPRGKSWTLAYDTNGYLASIQDPLGHYPLRVTYDSTGRVLSTKDGEANETDYAYSNDGTYDITTVSIPGRGDYVYKSIKNVLLSMEDPLHRVTSYAYDASFRQVAVTDPRGKTRRFHYDSRGNLVKEVAPAPLSYTRSWTYNATNDVTSATDWRGHATNYAYATSATSDYQVGQLKTVTDPESGVTTYTYYTASGVKQGLVKAITNARSKTTSFDYDSAGNLNSITSPLGFKTTMLYDSSGRRLHLDDPRGNVSGGTPANYRTQWSYDDGDNLLSVTNARSKTISYTYDDAGRRHTMVTPDGTTTYDYDNADRLTSTTDPDGGVETRTYDPDGLLASVETPEHAKTTYGYDDAGELTTLTEPRGNHTGATPSDYRWTYTYDDAGNRLTEAHPDAGTTNYTYDAINRVSSIDDPLNHTTQIDYDANSNVTKRTDELTHHRDYTYDNDNRLLTTTDERGKATTYEYYATGELKSVTTARGKRTSYTLDNDGRTNTMVEARGNESGATPSDFTWSYGYDEAGNLTSITDPLSDQTQMTYDAVNNKLTVQDANTHTTTYTYDDMNRVLSVTAPGSPTATTSYTYDALGDLHTRTDARTNLTTWNYDHDGQLSDVTNPIGTWSYTYDDAGNIKTLITPAGNNTPTSGDGEVDYTYDRMNRPTGVDYSDSTPDVTYAYDNAGRRTSMSDGTGSESYGYDNVNHLTDVTRGTNVFSYQYDAAGNVTKRTYPDSTVVDATYNDDELLQDLTVNTKTTSFTWDPAGRLATTNLPSGNGYVETRSYDRAGRLKEVANANGSTILSDFTRTLDPVGNPTLIATNRGGTTTNVAYEYDTRDRLTKACYSVTTCSGASNYLGYGYDKSSNLTAINRVGTVPNPASWTLSYNSADQLTSKTDGTTTTNYTYDDNGNQTSAGATSYAYDLANQLTSATVSGTTTSYSYDGDGKRLTSNTSGGSNLRFWWDVANPMPMLAQENNAGTGSSLRTYVNGPAGPISMATSGSTYYFHRDPLGSITDLTTATGSAEWKWDYEPYGDTLSQTKIDPSAPTVTLGFAGQYRDTETGTYQMRARQYDPVDGGFLALDPLAPDPLKSYTGSYAYVQGMPTVLIDPLGLCCDIGGALSSGVNSLESAGGAVVDTTTSTASTVYDTGTSAVGYAVDKTEAGAQWVAEHPGETLTIAATAATLVPGLGEGVMAVRLGVFAAQLYLAAQSAQNGDIVGAMTMLPGGGILRIARECRAVERVEQAGLDIKAAETSGGLPWAGYRPYAPDRELPRYPGGRPMPESEFPHTQLGTRKGAYPQSREFGENGRPVRDIDWTDHGSPQWHTDPHQHEYGPDGSRGSAGSVWP